MRPLLANLPEGSLWDLVLALRKEFELVDDDDEELPAVSTVGMILEGLIVSMVVPGEPPSACTLLLHPPAARNQVTGAAAPPPAHRRLTGSPRHLVSPHHHPVPLAKRPQSPPPSTPPTICPIRPPRLCYP